MPIRNVREAIVVHVFPMGKPREPGFRRARAEIRDGTDVPAIPTVIWRVVD
jgi:hypothetical protein